MKKGTPMPLADYARRLGAELFMLALGPLHFTGEMVGPLGGTSLKQWVHAIVGTWLWAAVIWWVIA